MIDYGMMSDIPEKDRYGLIGLVIGLKLKDFSLATENLLKVCFLFVLFQTPTLRSSSLAA